MKKGSEQCGWGLVKLLGKRRKRWENWPEQMLLENTVSVPFSFWAT